MTYIIILITVVVSAICFSDRRLLSGLALTPYLVVRKNQWYRIFTHAAVHSGWSHLLVNMLVLWSFGLNVESIFKSLQQTGMIRNFYLTYGALYFGALLLTGLLDTARFRNNSNYSSVGASGAVSAVIYTSIFFSPMGKVYIMGVLPLPGIIFGVLYLLYESWASRREGDRINHYAHIFGALFGFIFPLLIGPNMIGIFLSGFKF